MQINHDDPIILKLEELTGENDHYFQIFDVGKMKFLYTSSRVFRIFGVTPEEINPGHYTQLVHPDDEEKLGQARSRVYSFEREMFQTQKGSLYISFNIRMRNPAGNYSNFLVQEYMFFSPIPYKAVFMIQVITNIDWCQMKKDIFHLYVGKDLSHFRFPDQKLLAIGPGMTFREFQILRLIESGLSSKEIADKLFLSVHTVNTHRSNMLEKSGKAQISDLIYEFKGKGLL